MRVALVSLDQRWHDKAANLARCSEFAARAAAHGCSLAIFPEMTLTGYSLDMLALAEPGQDSATLRGFGGVAREAGVNLIFGASLTDAAHDKPLNSLALARAEGGVEVPYAKIHPFTFAGEEQALRAGSHLGVVQVAGMSLGCSVCYDLRFPEMYSLLAKSCNAVVNIANWPNRRVAHWRALLVARAIENQYYVFGVNRVGVDGNGLQYEKSSMAVSPEGQVIAPLHSERELDVYEIDLLSVAAYRSSFPTVADKRYSLYKELY
jgi:omega-amidase